MSSERQISNVILNKARDKLKCHPEQSEGCMHSVDSANRYTAPHHLTLSFRGAKQRGIYFGQSLRSPFSRAATSEMSRSAAIKSGV
jgi:hypothetical protein